MVMRMNQPINCKSINLLTLASTLLLLALPIGGCKSSAENAGALGAEAQALLQSGDIAQARVKISAAIAEQDDIANLHLLRGRIELAAGSKDGAFGAYSDALSLDANNGEALAAVAQLGLQTGHIDEAEKASQRLLTLYPGQKDGLMVKGLLDVARNRGTAALATAEEILKSSPNDEVGNLLKARAQFMLGDRALAIDTVENLRKSVGLTPYVAQALTELYRAQGNGQQTASNLAALITSQKDDLTLPPDLANTLFKLGRKNEALSVIGEFALRQDIDSSAAAAITALWEEYDQAQPGQTELSAIATKGTVPLRIAVARYLIDSGRPAEAIAVLAETPMSADVQSLRGEATIDQGQTEAGLNLIAAIMAADKSNCLALQANAKGMISQRRYDLAVNSAQRAFAECPQLAAAHLSATTALEARSPTQALPVELAFREAFARNPQNLKIATRYVEWLERRGQPAKAVAIARRLTVNAPAKLSGWNLFRAVCARHSEQNCAADAAAGATRAAKRFAIDPLPGETLDVKLFGTLE